MVLVKTTTETRVYIELGRTEAAALQTVLGAMSTSDYKSFLKTHDTSLTRIELDKYAKHLGEIWSALKNS